MRKNGLSSQRMGADDACAARDGAGDSDSSVLGVDVDIDMKAHRPRGGERHCIGLEQPKADAAARLVRGNITKMARAARPLLLRNGVDRARIEASTC